MEKQFEKTLQELNEKREKLLQKIGSASAEEKETLELELKNLDYTIEMTEVNHFNRGNAQ